MMSKKHCSATKSWNGNQNKWVGRKKATSISEKPEEHWQERGGKKRIREVVNKNQKKQEYS